METMTQAPQRRPLGAALGTEGPRDRSVKATRTRHPVTGRSILFVNPMHTHGFVGMKREEAWPLIEELADHATEERFVCHHRWRVR
jgi:alpha-ketoglutarate-dependent taurine dioxygenase